jgi:hypothetical protein
LIEVITIVVCWAVFGYAVGLDFATLIAFLLGGIVIGRMSKGVTITEAAIAGVLGGLVFFLLGGLLYGFIFGIAGFVLAGVGGYIGEKWQEYSQKA